MDKTVMVPIAQGTEEIEAVVVIDLLRRAGISVKVAGENDIITCSRGVKIIPDIFIEDIHETQLFDAIILPGGANGTKNLIENKHLERILENNKKNDNLIAAICAAPTILDSFGLLPYGIQITSHPSSESILEKYNYQEENVVIHGNIITSRGAGTAIEFALKIIEILINKDVAERIAKEIVYI